MMEHGWVSLDYMSRAGHHIFKTVVAAVPGNQHLLLLLAFTLFPPSSSVVVCEPGEADTGITTEGVHAAV